MAAALPDYPEALANTLRVAEMCDVEFDFSRRFAPKYEPPAKKTADEYLRELVYQGAEGRYGELTDELRERIDYELDVIKGKGRGQSLGFPTVNFLPPEHKLIPLDGVYKARVIENKTEHLGAMFCRHDLIEVHIIGYSGALYGKRITAKFLKRIRGIEHFADDAALKAAIASDVKSIVQGAG